MMNLFESYIHCCNVEYQNIKKGILEDYSSASNLMKLKKDGTASTFFTKNSDNIVAASWYLADVATNTLGELERVTSLDLEHKVKDELNDFMKNINSQGNKHFIKDIENSKKPKEVLKAISCLKPGWEPLIKDSFNVRNNRGIFKVTKPKGIDYKDVAYVTDNLSLLTIYWDEVNYLNLQLKKIVNGHYF